MAQEMEQLEKEIRDLHNARPGDVLVLRKPVKGTSVSSRLYHRRPRGLSDSPRTTFLPGGARALIIGVEDAWAYVIVEGELGWIAHYDISEIERQ